MAFIYKITSPSGKIYIGSTINLSRRLQVYASIPSKSQIKLYRSIQKYGWSAHKVDTILKTTNENRFIAERNLGEYYNVLKNGLNLQLPKIDDRISVSQETRDKIRVSHIGMTISEETRQKLSKAKSGRKLSEHTKKLISIARTGKIASNETRLRQSVIRKGRKLPEDRLIKMLEGMKRSRKPSQIHAAQQTRKKIILNKETGIFYESISEAANSITHVKRTTLNTWLLKNKSNFMYA